MLLYSISRLLHPYLVYSALFNLGSGGTEEVGRIIRRWIGGGKGERTVGDLSRYLDVQQH